MQHSTNDSNGPMLNPLGQLVSPGAFIHHAPLVLVAAAAAVGEPAPDPEPGDRRFLDAYPTTRAALKALMQTKGPEDFAALTGVDLEDLQAELRREAALPDVDEAEGEDQADPPGAVARNLDGSPLVPGPDGLVPGETLQLTDEERAKLPPLDPNADPDAVKRAVGLTPLTGDGDGQVVTVLEGAGAAGTGPAAVEVTDQPLAGQGEGIQLGAGDPPADPIVPAVGSTSDNPSPLGAVTEVPGDGTPPNGTDGTPAADHTPGTPPAGDAEQPAAGAVPQPLKGEPGKTAGPAKPRTPGKSGK